MIKVINVISDSNIGGAGRMLLTFLKNYNRSIIDMTVVLPVNSKLCVELEKLEVRYIGIEGLAEKSFKLEAVSALLEIFGKEHPNIVHTHASMSARIAARIYGKCKIIYTRHSVFPNSAKLTTFPAKQAFGAVNNFFADSIIAVSPAAKDNIVETGVNPDKVTVIYNGVDPLTPLLNEEKIAVRKNYGLDETDFVCGIFARLTPVKGHEYILQAAKILEEETSIKIIIAGVGESEKALRAKGKALKNTIFTGFIENVGKVMGAIDLQLNASYGTEATSLALLEGMSIGIPAVVTDFGGNPYVISSGKNGIIVGQKNGRSIADAIMRLYKDKQLYNKLSVQSKKVYSERFTSLCMTKNIENLYLSIYN